MKRDDDAPHEEGGHMSSTRGRIMRIPNGELGYLVILSHHDSQSTEHAFATMREAEAFIKRNTPVPGAILSTTYDRPACEPSILADTRANMDDESILARLTVIDRRLRLISTEKAASVLAGALANAGICGPERLRLVSETERILDELDGRSID